jgi:hypothetical protein
MTTGAKFRAGVGQGGKDLGSPTWGMGVVKLDLAERSSETGSG